MRFRNIPRQVRNTIDRIVYPSEDGFVRNARQMRYKQEYGNFYVNALCPVIYTAKKIKSTVNNDQLSIKTKTGFCIKYIGGEVVMDIIRFGGLYLIAKSVYHAWSG